MKKFIYSFVGALMVAGLTVSIPTTSVAQGQQGADEDVERCKYYVENYSYFDNVGECMKRLRTGSVKYCQYLKERGYYDIPGAYFDNQGDCVSYYRSRGY